MSDREKYRDTRCPLYCSTKLSAEPVGVAVASECPLDDTYKPPPWNCPFLSRCVVPEETAENVSEFQDNYVSSRAAQVPRAIHRSAHHSRSPP